MTLVTPLDRFFLRLAHCLALIGALLLASASEASEAPSLSNADATSTMASGATAIAAAYSRETRYGIWRKGERIGEHRLRFGADGDDLLVDIESRIRITMLAIPVFRFEYAATERWDDEGLREVDVRITENGETVRTSLRSDASGSVLSGPDGESTATRLDYASNHWHGGVLRAARVFNTLTGTVSDVDIEPVGRDTRTPADGSDATFDYTRYAYSGDIVAEAWYDDGGRWVGLAFDGEDGSRIEYRLEP